MSRRVYVPATLDLLRAWYDAREVPAEAERLVAADDSEESEYDALMSAADDSAALVGTRGRRVVVVAEVGADEVDASLAWRRLVALHADPEAVATDRPDDLDEPAWFGVQEVADLLRG